MPATVHLVRHAQGVHNLCVENEKLVDPDLTELGHRQCSVLKSDFPHHAKVTHVVASPLRRTLHTALESFTPFDPASPAATKNHRIVATPVIQEISNNLCDYGSPLAKLRREFGERVDFSRLPEDDGWLNKDKGSPWAPNLHHLQSRARQARVLVRELAGGANPDADVHIVVVTHGGFVHFMTDDYDGLSISGSGWKNAERRSYQFADLTGQDPEAHLKETDASWRRRRGSEIPLTWAEQMELKSVLREAFKAEYGHFNEHVDEAVVN